MAIENGILKPSGVIQLRGGTAENLASVNPVLNEREIMIETETGKIKVGKAFYRNGMLNTLNWNDLPYIGGWLSNEIEELGDGVDRTVIHNMIMARNYITKEEALSAIADGTFKNMWIGTHIGGMYGGYIVLDFGYFCTQTPTPHIVVAPYSNGIEIGGFSSIAGFSSGGYYGFTELRQWLATKAEEAVNYFGEEHVLTHDEYLCDGMANGEPSSYGWHESQCELMTLQQVYGGYFYGAGVMSNINANQQFSYFKLARNNWNQVSPGVLRDVASANSLWLANSPSYPEKYTVEAFVLGENEAYFGATPYLCIC